MTDPTPGIPQVTGNPTAAPLSWSALGDLFLRPTTFFRSVDLRHGSGWLVAILLVGMSGTIGRIDQNLVREDLGEARPGWESFGPMLTGSWTSYWAFVLIVGALGAVFIWYVGGWWYNLRVRWSGAEQFDRRDGRLVYTFAGLVAAIPAIAYALVATAVFPDYQAAWESEELWSVPLLAFPFWAVVVSYRGVRATFPVRPGRARIWFLVLPLVAYIFVFGLIGVLYTLFDPGTGGVFV